MKFRARIGNGLQLSRMVQALDRVGDTCVMHLNRDVIAFAIVGDAGDGLQVWGDLVHTPTFTEYRIESRADDQISVTLKTANLATALRSSCSQINVSTVVKLTKKTGVPTLSFEIDKAQSQVQINHDVPVRLVLDEDELSRYREPSIPEAYIDRAASVAVPAGDVRGLRNAVDRMSSFATHLVLSASAGPGGGSLRVHMRTESHMRISTTFGDLEAVTTGPPRASGVTAEAKVEAKKLHRALQSLIASDLRVGHVICCVIPDRTVVLKCALGDQEGHNALVYYLPVHFLDAAGAAAG